jgi:hypothetical protein
MSPTPGKDTLTTNHCQSLEAAVNLVKKDIEKAKAGATEEGKKLLAEAELLLKQVANVKRSVAKIPLTHPDYLKAKTAVANFQKEAKTELAAIAKRATEAAKPANIDVALLKYTSPKFAHNAGNAGTLPKWTFQYMDTATKKTGQVEIVMEKSMTKDEPTAKMMSDAAVAEVKKHYPGANVKINNASLEK